jgi:hypothetical protein
MLLLRTNLWLVVEPCMQVVPISTPLQIQTILVILTPEVALEEMTLRYKVYLNL